VALPGVDPQSFVKVLHEHIKRPYELDGRDLEPWQSLPELPTSEEIMGTYGVNSDPRTNNRVDVENRIPYLPTNIIDAPWADKLQYIGAHYRLIREDGISPLRSAVAEFKTNSEFIDSRNFCVYNHVSSFEKPRFHLFTHSRSTSLDTHFPPKVLLRELSSLQRVSERVLDGASRSDYSKEQL
jgi:hypothetical protein